MCRSPQLTCHRSLGKQTGWEVTQAPFLPGRVGWLCRGLPLYGSQGPCRSALSGWWTRKRKLGEEALKNLGPAILTHPRAPRSAMYVLIFYRTPALARLVKEGMTTLAPLGSSLPVVLAGLLPLPPPSPPRTPQMGELLSLPSPLLPTPHFSLPPSASRLTSSWNLPLFHQAHF